MVLYLAEKNQQSISQVLVEKNLKIKLENPAENLKVARYHLQIARQLNTISDK